MTTFNHLYSSEKRLRSFLLEHNMDKDSALFIQLFMGNNDPDAMRSVLETIHTLLPHASIIATSTAGEIVEGGMQDNTTVLSITHFNATTVKVALIEGDTEAEMATKIVNEMIGPQSKLLLMFNNVYSNDGEVLLSALEKQAPDLMIAGGNAGDNGAFTMQTVVGTGQEVSTTGVAVAVLDSEILQVFNEKLFNWQTIGENMLVTKAEGATVYEINHKSAQDVYREFLGDEVASELPGSGVEFPLIFTENGLDIARAPVAVGDNGELIMAGHIKEGTAVKFGFGDVTENAKNVQKTVKKFSHLPLEGIFIYSCSARKYFLNDKLNDELEMLQRIVPTSGFITYGEFFKKDKTNKMLNVTSTLLGLSEDSKRIHSIDLQIPKNTNQTRTLNALTHLVKQTSRHIEEKNHELTQFMGLIQSSTIYSKTDLKGVITDVNDRFVELSGYSKAELIGKPHSIVRHADVPKEIYKKMWSEIQSKKPWRGIIKNRTKDGKDYYVRSFIFPQLDVHGEIKEYISLRDDITQEMEDKKRLEGDLDLLTETNTEREFLLNQYQKVIDMSSAFFRIDKDQEIVYVNEVFCDLFGCEREAMLHKKLSDLIESKFYEDHSTQIAKALEDDGRWHGVATLQREDASVLYMDTTINGIYDINNNLLEYMVSQHDITEVINAKDEIAATQRDVIYALGAIGESRSRETGNHVKRVAEYSRLLALHYGLDSEKAEMLKMASPMHDIGKVAIPDAILNKPGKLTPEEFKVMKTHAMLGYNMLKNSKREILQTAATLALTHHEKWDGSGYPKGLKGEDIDICGRITALADVFDALGSDRCYKQAWSDDKVFALIKEESGKHFDPKLVELFFENLDEFLEIRETFKD